ncbi:quorum-sensing autoinducer 2 sensor kinase/phosphatase LuxQ [Vibrio lentus]|uniref:Autoinducer 2 sensor kinase/phosphatase LuxQ n=1 Tax=Vibrio lentus TaxID=136468 RepID=A0A2N7BKS6_9VIBR|nr:quorum-sensing autoinducer 2 sensor kinase/phosphatase LuxQ [Vibrio lentus]PME55507.1 ATPase [Vibrio lentus]PME57977.1 ATPase [Vibrio lentus]PME94584.1 ATPase [Vibrio lentus]PMH91642.1 ATPase [Vibrio lentus]PMI06387.1 ATPase [Vibrio lentus]
MKKSYASTPRNTLAKLITRIIILVIGVMALGVLIHNYETSSSIVKQETNRTVQQTSSLIQNMFDYRLSVLQIHQDSSSHSAVLREYFNSNDDEEALSYFFFGVDQREPDHAPDLRFVSTHDGVVWDDGNGRFYGLDQSNLENISGEVAFSSNWHFLKLVTEIGDRHLLARRTPIVDNETGEVLGQLYIAIVLDNNFSLAESIQQGSNCENIVIEAHGTPVTSTFSGDESYTITDILNYKQHDQLPSHFVTIATIKINAVDTPLIIRAVQKNTNFIALEENYERAIIVVVVVIILMSFFAKAWIQRKVAAELDKLMDFTRSASGDNEDYNKFDGSNIFEFHHIGCTLEDTFERLSEQNQKFQDLFNFAHSPILVWSDKGDLIQMNPAARMALFDEDNSYGVIAQEFEQRMLPNIQMVVQGSKLTGINVPIGDKVFRWNMSAIRVEHGITGVVVQGQDITKLIEAERQADRAREEAEYLANVRADFLAKMSHEIRTPLNGILGVSQLMKRSVQSEDNRDQVDVLCNSAEHLLAVLNDILDFSKIEQGQFNIQKKSFRLAELVNTLDSIYRPLCEDKSVVFCIDNHLANDIEISTDQVRLNQIMFNLLSNALKFTHQGRISVSFELESIFNSDQASLIVRVKDTGIGIDGSKIDAVFEPFVQEDETTTREYGGTGLGLTIVKNLVDMLEGDIQVRSAKGEGSEFVIEIPVELSSQPSLGSPQQPHIDPHALFSHSFKVLLVEDNHTNAFIAQAFCKKYGMAVAWAKDGLEAIELAKAEVFDLILMDNQLPNLGGVETTQQLRSEIGISTPIYACTADAQQSTRDSFMAAGANYVIVKPIKEESLHQAFVHFKNVYSGDMDQPS